jgi:aspartate aminotransferase
MRIAAKALEMKAGGIDLVDFSVGEPDFPTPDNIKEAAKKAIDSGFTKYTVNPGHPELRKAIAGKLKKENGLDYTPGEIIVSNGAKQALYNVVFALIDSGDEVVMALPYWPSHPEMVKLAGGIPVMVNTKLENGFRITPGELEASITPSTKAFILCNPANPTGALYSHEELKGLSDVIQKHNLFVIADEIYEKLSYDKSQPSCFVKALLTSANVFLLKAYLTALERTVSSIAS